MWPAMRGGPKYHRTIPAGAFPESGGGRFGVLSLGVLLGLFTARRRAVTRIG